jgi:hypothetical protein
MSQLNLTLKYPFSSDIPFCQVDQVSVPNGCLDPSFSRQDCDAENSTWWTPATSQSECLSKKGCYDHINTLFAFSPKNEVQYEGVTTAKGADMKALFPTQADCALNGGTYRSYFEWTPSMWVRSTVR